MINCMAVHNTTQTMVRNCLETITLLTSMATASSMIQIGYLTVILILPKIRTTLPLVSNGKDSVRLCRFMELTTSPAMYRLIVLVAALIQFMIWARGGQRTIRVLMLLYPAGYQVPVIIMVPNICLMVPMCG